MTKSLHVDRRSAHASHIGVASHVVEVVNGEDAREERLHDAHPGGDCCIFKRWLRDEEADPAWINRLCGGERVARGRVAGRSTQLRDDRRELPLNDERGEIFMGEALPLRSARISRSREGFKNGVIKEVREGPVANVVQQSCDAQRLNDEPFTWWSFTVVREPCRK